MPWNFALNAKIDYKTKIAKAGNDELMAGIFEELEANVINFSMKKFRSMVKNKKSKIHVFRFVSNEQYEASRRANVEDLRIKHLSQKHESAFINGLLRGLPPIRSVDYKIEVDKNSKPPHRPLYQLSPTDFKSMKNYVRELLDK